MMRFGIVGTNFISDSFAEACKLSGSAEAFAVYSRKAETGDTFAKRHNICRVYTDYKEMLADGDVDAVYIASPTMCHSEQAVMALDAGKDVLCEKMIAATLDEFILMRDAAKRNGRVLIEAMRPDFDDILDIVREKLPLIGKIKGAGLEYRQYSRRYDKFKEGIVLNAFDPSMKNSALADIGIYPLHFAHSLFGEPKSIDSEATFLHNGFMAEGISRLEYDGFCAEVSYSKIVEGKNISVIRGEYGEISFDKINEPTAVTTVLYSGDTEVLKAPIEKSNMVREVRDFVRIVQSDHALGEKLLSVTEMTMRSVDKIYRQCKINFKPE